MAAGVVFGELDRPFDRVASARSTEYDLAVSAKTVRCDVVKPFDEFDSCLGREVNRMSDFIELLVDSLKHVRVGVSDVQHADSGEKVEECVPVDVPDGCTFGLLDRNRYATRVSDGVAVDLVAGPTTVPFVVRGPCPRLAPSKSGSRRSVGLLPCVKTLVRVYIFKEYSKKGTQKSSKTS